MLITNRPVVAEHPALWDIAPTILDLFGIDTPPEMRGTPLFKEA